jgi:hypothetical protein
LAETHASSSRPTGQTMPRRSSAAVNSANSPNEVINEFVSLNLKSSAISVAGRFG